MAINKEYSTPLYQQLVDSVKAQIRDGILKEDDRLGSEQDISREYNVSRITVRKAFEILADEGYVTKRQGIGTFVSAKKVNNFNEGQARGFTEMCMQDGNVPSSELISVGWVSNVPSISRHLQVPEEDPVLRVLRVRKCDGVPVMVEDGYFPKRFSYLMRFFANMEQSLLISARSWVSVMLLNLRHRSWKYANARLCFYRKILPMTRMGKLYIIQN